MRRDLHVGFDLSDSAGKPVWVVMNHAHEARCVTLPEAMKDVLTQERVKDVQIAPLEARWLRA